MALHGPTLVQTRRQQNGPIAQNRTQNVRWEKSKSWRHVIRDRQFYCLLILINCFVGCEEQTDLLSKKDRKVTVAQNAQLSEGRNDVAAHGWSNMLVIGQFS